MDEPRNTKTDSAENSPGVRMKGAPSSSPMLPLLLEVGCEEIPARFLAEAQEHLGERLRSGLIEARLVDDQPVGAVREPPLQTYSTPRRLVVHVPAVLERQPDKVEEIHGPPVKVAFDKDGKPTRAAEGFAAKNDARVEDLYRVTTPKGEYLAVTKTTQGRPALEVLGEVLPGVITGLSFPKSMYWEGSNVRFVRPIRWILALLGEGEAAKVVPFEIAGVPSGNFTHGHRAFNSDAISVTGFAAYARELRQCGVEFDPEMRRQRVREEVKAALEGISVVPDPGLEGWIVNSTEWPRALGGDFDARFLKLPREILITVMRDHQKYFAVEDQQGSLQPRFVTVLNREGDPQGLIKKGHERVLAARFADAEFFWNADQKILLRDRMPMLDRVTYQAKLGSYGDKVRRMEQLANSISYLLRDQNRIDESGKVAAERAARLCKCDLTTQMVQEFPELQGVVGGLYASAQGEPEAVAHAIYDHYKPQGSEGSCPRSLVGAVVALADKIDAVASGFVAGLAPSGSADPFGLRRGANGILRILLRSSISVNLRPLVLSTINALSAHDPSLYVQTAKAQSLADDVVSFFRERLASYLEAIEGLKYDVVRASLAAKGPDNLWHALDDNPVNIAARARDCSEVKVRHEEAFVRLSSASKRIRNILTKSADGATYLGERFDTESFEQEEERALGQALSDVVKRATDLAAQRNFASALQTIAELSQPVDRFFDSVMVMVDDVGLRENRLRLLNHLNGVFSGIIDFSQIVLEEGPNPEA